MITVVGTGTGAPLPPDAEAAVARAGLVVGARRHLAAARLPEGGEEDAFFQGRYLDFFERRAGVWKIIRRRGLSDYTAPAIPAQVNYAEWPQGQHSTHFPDDDYYQMRQQFEGKA